MLDTTSVEDISVKLLGANGSGKSSLKSQLHEQIFHRKADHRRFRYLVSEQDEVAISDTREQPTAFLVTFSIVNAYSINAALKVVDETKSMWPEAQIFLVGTKVDLVPRDYSELDLCYRCLDSKIAFSERLPFYAVSSTTGEGFQEMAYGIFNDLHPATPTLRWPVIRTLFDGLVTRLLDTVADTFALSVPEDVNIDSPNPVEVDDTTVEELREGPLARAWDLALSAHCVFGRNNPSSSPTHRINNAYIVKLRSENELTSMQYVRAHTQVPVPQPRCLTLSKKWLIMDFIQGRMLEECWDSLGFFRQFRIACTLRKYISQLRRLSSTAPGSDGMVGGVLFDERQLGPIPSALDFKLWCNQIAQLGWSYWARSMKSQGVLCDVTPPPKVVDDWDLTFVHTDLNMSNILLSDDGVLWVVDWAEAGFYPKWLESVGMNRFYDEPDSWRRYRWFIAGTYPDYEDFWAKFICGVVREWSYKGSAYV